MFGLKKKNVSEGHVAFGNGKLVSLEKVPDQVFSQKMMGDGYAIELRDGHIYAPVSGIATMVFQTGHAFGLTTDDGVEVLLHLGVDTVELNGKGFSGKVKQGDRVKQGDELTEMDLALIEAEGKPTISMCIFTSGEKINILKEDSDVHALETEIIEITK